MCTPLKTINDSLSHRRRYMKHYFPINYTIRVHAYEVFRLSNISRMRPQVEVLLLQQLWFQVYQGVLKKIIRVLSERHPSRSYTAELERRFQDAEGVFVQSHPVEVFQQELPEAIQETWDHLTEDPERVPESRWRYASPKALLDNLCYTMHCLFRECFPSTELHQTVVSLSGGRAGRNRTSRRATSSWTTVARNRTPDGGERPSGGSNQRIHGNVWGGSSSLMSDTRAAAITLSTDEMEPGGEGRGGEPEGHVTNAAPTLRV
nr:interleukin 34 [Takifugu obscurus]